MQRQYAKTKVINDRHLEFLQKIRRKEVVFPNEFSESLGMSIRKAREENGLNQSLLADKLSRSQASISDIEKGKIDISVLTLVLIAIELNKPISYFIPDMTFLTSLQDIRNKDEEELLTIFRTMEYEPFGDPKLVLRFVKMLLAHEEEQKSERQFPQES